MAKDSSSLDLNKRTTKIFEDIRDICENYIGDSVLADADPDLCIAMIKDKISEYDKIWEESILSRLL